MNKSDVLILAGAAIAAYFIVKKFAPASGASTARNKAAANYYGTTPGSQQTDMLAAQDAAFLPAVWAPGSVDATTSSGVAI